MRSPRYEPRQVSARRRPTRGRVRAAYSPFAMPLLVFRTPAAFAHATLVCSEPADGGDKARRRKHTDRGLTIPAAGRWNIEVSIAWPGSRTVKLEGTIDIRCPAGREAPGRSPAVSRKHGLVNAHPVDDPVPWMGETRIVAVDRAAAAVTEFDADLASALLLRCGGRRLLRLRLVGAALGLRLVA